MQYLGGKSRIAKQLAEVIDSVRHPGQWVWDAFCGGLSMSVALRKKGPVWSTDACVPLISLYRAVQAGWEPPTEVSKEMWQAARALPDSDPMKGFAGFACSFNGIYFTSYAKPIPGKVCPAYAIGSMKKAFKVLDALVAYCDFFNVQPQSCEAILYLDPPYAGTAGYDGAPPFDSEAFVQRVREWSRWTHVFVSEYSFPIGECVWFKEVPVTVAAVKHSKRVERLYYIGPTTDLDGTK